MIRYLLKLIQGKRTLRRTDYAKSNQHRKLESEEQGVKNQATLMEITGKIFAAITSEHSLSIMPREIR